jgi:hypothetical protein
LRSPDQTIDPDVKETCSQSSGCSDIVPQSNSRRECRVPELPLEEEVYVEHPGIVGDRAAVGGSSPCLPKRPVRPQSTVGTEGGCGAGRRVKQHHDRSGAGTRAYP